MKTIFYHCDFCQMWIGLKGATSGTIPKIAAVHWTCSVASQCTQNNIIYASVYIMLSYVQLRQ